MSFRFSRPPAFERIFIKYPVMLGGGDPLFGGPKNLPMLAAAAYGRPSTGSELEEEHLYLASYNKGYAALRGLVTDVPACRARVEAVLAEEGLQRAPAA